MARRHELPASRRARRAAVAVSHRRSSGQPAAARSAVERSDRRRAARRSCRSNSNRRSTRSSPDFPMRLTTGRRLDSFNTGVQTGGYTSPLRFGETIDLAPEDGVSLGVAEGERVRIVSRRGAVDAPVRFDRGLRPGLAFMTHALSRRGRHQPADHRRDRSEVGHRGVQGVGRSNRETLSGPSPDSRGGRDARRTRSDRRRLDVDVGPGSGPAPAAARAPRRSRARRLDQRRRAESHLRAAVRAAGGGVRRRVVLQHVLDEAAAAVGRACLRRHRVPRERRGGAVPRSRAAARQGRRADSRTAARCGCAARVLASASVRRPCSFSAPERSTPTAA